MFSEIMPILTTGGIGSIIVAAGWVYLRGSRNKYDSFKDIIATVRKEKLTVIKERNQEARRADEERDRAEAAETLLRKKSNEKHEALTILTKERIRTELWFENLQLDVTKFLHSQGISTEFKIKPLPERIKLSSEQNS